MAKYILNCRMFVFTFFVVGILGCNNTPQSNTVISDNLPTYEEFVANHSFPYIASVERQNQLIQNYYNLSTGQTKQEVIQIIGEPDYSEPLYSKTPSPGYFGDDWLYFLEKPDPPILNVENDKRIHVFFDINGKQTGSFQMFKV